MKHNFLKRTISVLLILCMLLGLVPAFSQQAQAATETVRTETELISTSTAPSTTASEVDALFSARSEGQHPRILADADKFAELRQKIQTDDYSKVLYARMYAYCLEELPKAVSEYEIPDGVRLLSVSRTASARIIWMSMVYQISGERRFAERAVEEMLAVCNFSDWNPAHYLDVAQMAYGVGIGYDWLYHFMTEDQRATVRNALYNYAVLTGMNHWAHNITSNWNPWCMAGLAIASAAIYEDYRDDCSALLAKTVTSIQGSLALFTPLGAYPEGTSYYRLGTEFSAIYFETMKSVLGTDFGLSDLPGVQESSKYLLATTGYVNTFNFGDCSDAILDGAMLHWYAKRFNMPELSVYQRKFQSRNYELMDEVLALIWYEPELVEDYSSDNAQLDYLMYSDEYQSVASFRSFDADPAQVYAAIKSGYNSTSHADMDIGSFVMEAMGERWFMDLGSDNYNLPGYGYSNGYAETIGRWTYYRKRAEGHNTLVINPGTRGGQDAFATCQISDYKSSYDGGYATVDMLDAYNNDGDEYTEDVVTSANRGLLLFDNRSRVLLRDELTCSSASEVYWFAHTQAEISISADGKTAELTQNGKTLLAQIVEPAGAVFTQMDAEPLVDYSLDPENEKSREGIRKLVIHLQNVTSAEISVVFTPILQESDRNKELPDVTLETLGDQLNDYNDQTTLKANAQGVYEIYNVDQLCKLSDMVRQGNNFGGKTIKLMNDIDMQGRTFQPIGGCIPVGSDPGALSFNGTFDGNGHTVKNLCIFEPDSQFVGFFGRVYNATIRNLGIEGGVVFGSGKTAGLIGASGYTTVDNCYNKANVISYGNHAGGIIGEMGTDCGISNCYNNADITNHFSASGGLVGYIVSDATVTITNSYHVGNVADSKGRIGLIGYYETTTGDYQISNLTLTNCYSTTALKPAEVPDDATRESITEFYQVTEAELVGKTVALGDAFIADCEWENDGYPVLKWQCDTVLPDDLALSTEAELRLLSYNVNSGAADYKNKTVTLRNDIDLDSREWVPIGGGNPTDTAGYTFKGTFDGKGYAVKNLKISTPTRYFVGFFGGVNGKVLNFGVKSGSVKGLDKVGGICGYIGGTGTMDNCYNRASVEGRSFVGGLVGMGALVTISNCYNTGTITATNEAGGIVGYFSSAAGNSSIANCYNAGTLSGKKMGGIVSAVNANLTGVPISNSYALNDVALFYDSARCIATDCASCTADELKAKAATLGSAFATDSMIPQNGGYPILNSSLYGTAAKALQPDDDGVYYISTAEQLRSIAYMVNVLGNDFSGKTVKLCADIDLENREWIPIGGNALADSPTPPTFNGTFDGNGHMIENLAITSGNLYIGLFGMVSSAHIKNVGIASGMVVGNGKVAGLVGSSKGGAVIEGCYNKANVSGATATGGIVGMLGGKDTVKNCYNTASVGANDNVAAGIVGYLGSGAATAKIQNCYNIGTQSAGIVGRCNAALTNAEMSNCYTIDTVELAYQPYSIVVTDCAQVDAATLRTYVTTLGSAYAEDYLAQNNIFPVLAWQNGDAATTLTQDANGVYLINNADELRLLSYLVRKGNNFKGEEFLLTTDIDLENKPWLSIGGYLESTLYSFYGSFNGAGHVIRNINAWELTSGFTGLFGRAGYGVIENLGIESGVIIGKEKVAGIAGNLAYGATIRRCYNKATLYGNLHVGGLAGMVNLGTSVIRSSYNTGMVYSRNVIDQSAGLVGYLASDEKNTLIENCYDIGNYNAALCHINDTATGTMIRNTYSVGSVKMVAKSLTGAYTLENGSGLVSSATMKTYHTVLGSDFVLDKNLINQGYPVLAWERSSEQPDKTYLFFDFTNTERDQLRYARYTYGFTQFDDPTALNWLLASDTGSNVKIDSETDTLILNTESPLDAADWPAAYTDPYIPETNDAYPLHFSPAEAQVVQVRFKMENFRAGEQVKNSTETKSSPYLKIQYCADGVTKFVNGTSNFVGHADYIDADEWFIATIDLNGDFKSAKEIQRLRIYFGGVESKSAEEMGKVTIDYIYVGPKASVPTQESLYFDFTNTEEDQARYDSKTYGYVQFDDPDEVHWNYNSKLLTGTSIADGALTYHVVGAYDSTVSYPGVYADTYTKGNTDPLHYDPVNAEVYQIRFKMEGMAKQGVPYVDLHLWGLDDNDNALTNAENLNQPYVNIPQTALTSGEYIVLTVDLTKDNLANCAEIIRVRAFFGQLKSADPNNPGKISIDYIYMGTEKDLPTPRYTVTFVDGDGNELQSGYVHEGEAAVYSGETPTKSYDGTYHYTFSSWDKDFSNITSDLTVTAQFTEASHDFSYTSSGTASGGHTRKCSCGYSDTKSHTYTNVVTAPTCTAKGYTTHTCNDCGYSYKDSYTAALEHNYTNYVVTKAPTTTATGVLTGTCSRCSATTTVTLPKLTTTDYNYSVVKAATCAATGTGRYTWKTTTYGSFYFDVTIAKTTNHSYNSGVITTQPTCTATGIKTYTCSVCNGTKTETVAANGHTEVTDAAVAATCTTTGLTEGKHCSVCNTVLVAQQTVAALGHDYSSKVTTATCTEQGYTTYTCSRCSNSYKDSYTAALGHNYTNYVVTKAPTTTATGVLTGTCSRCSATTTVTLPKLTTTDYNYSVVKAATCAAPGTGRYTWKTTTYGSFYFDVTIAKTTNHSYNSGVITTQPTCTATGIKTYTCSVCSGTKTETVAALGHDYKPTVTNPNCTEQGYTTYQCSRCSASYVSDYVDATGHSYNAVVTAPTCTAKGYTTYTCSVCGDKYTANETAATGHSYSSKVTTAATCTTAGVRTYTCSKCSDSYTEEIPATGHSYESVVTAPTCTAKGYTTYTCSVCGDKYTANETAALGHNYIGEVTKEPTCTAEGVMTYTCQNDASHTYTEPIDKLLHTDANSDGKCDGCGCSTNAAAQDIALSYARTVETNLLNKLTITDVSAELMSDLELTGLSYADTSDEKLGAAALVDADGDGKSETLRFAPMDIISKVIHLNCTVKITATDGRVYYRVIPVNVVPATIMYYETDFAEDVFELSNPEPEATEDNYLYFDFTNSDQAQKRYANDPAYGGKNLDLSSNWRTHNTYSIQPIMDYTTGTMTIGYKNNVRNSMWYDFNSTATNYTMAFHPADNSYVKMRLRFNDMTAGSYPNLRIVYYIGSDIYEGYTDKVERPYWLDAHYFTDEDITSGEFITITFPVVRTGDTVHSTWTNLRLVLENVESDGTLGTVDIDYIYIGTEDDFDKVRAANNQVWQTIDDGTDAANDDVKTEQTEIVYGYDSIYENDTKLSNGSSLYVEGTGVAKIAKDSEENIVIDYENTAAYTEATFSFTGTGFDIISRTGKDQGGLRVVVCDSNGYVKKTVTVLNKGVLELYQIPVVSVEGLDYGTYTVHIFVNAAYDYGNDGDGDIYGGALDRGGQFFFDAVRIYNPINTDATDTDSAYAYALYQSHGEADPTFKELRQILIDASKEISSDEMDGVVYLDTASGSTSSIAEYTAVGPNNEVYLSTGKAIAFKLEVEGTIPSSIDIGAKSANGTPVSMTTRIGTSASATTSISTATALYYPLEIASNAWQTSNGKSYVFITISNSGSSGILSITDVKYAYGASAQALGLKSVRFLVDAQMLENLNAACEHVYAYTNNGENHTAICANCDYSATEEHSYVDGACVCGAVEAAEPEYELDPNLSFIMSISAGAEMQVRYTILNAKVSSFESFYLVVTKAVADGEPVVTTFELDAMTPVTNTGGAVTAYQATYAGINAKEMGDEFATVLYAVASDGTIHYSATNTNSMKSYLIGKIDAESSIAELKTMCVDMLNYGAAAQVRLNYNTENLVNADLTEEQLAYATTEAPEATNNTATTGDGNKLISSVSLQSKVLLYLNSNYAGTDASTLKYVIKAAESGETLDTLDVTKSGNFRQAVYSNVGAKQMRQLLTITLYDGDTAVSQTLTWSIESYVASVREKTASTEAEIDMVNAMLTYGDSVAAYMTASGQ